MLLFSSSRVVWECSPKLGGKFHLKLNTSERPIAHKYREGKKQRTLKRELKVLEIVKSEATESPIMINITLGEIHFISIRLWARIYFDCNEWVAFFKRVQEKEEGVFFFFFFFLYVIHYLYVAVKDRRILLWASFLIGRMHFSSFFGVPASVFWAGQHSWDK